MSDFVKCEVKGLAELQKKMEELALKVGRDGVREALREGGRIFQDEMERTAPENIGDPRFPKGFLKGKINTRVKVMPDVLAGTASIGPRGHIDYPYYASGAYKLIKNKKTGRRKKIGRIGLRTVAAWIEFGTKKMAAFPFMSRAFDTAKNIALQRVIAVLQKYLFDHTK